VPSFSPLNRSLSSLLRIRIWLRSFQRNLRKSRSLNVYASPSKSYRYALSAVPPSPVPIRYCFSPEVGWMLFGILCVALHRSSCWSGTFRITELQSLIRGMNICSFYSSPFFFCPPFLRQKKNFPTSDGTVPDIRSCTRMTHPYLPSRHDPLFETILSGESVLECVVDKPTSTATCCFPPPPFSTRHYLLRGVSGCNTPSFYVFFCPPFSPS